jgi:hypothetical protein
VLGLKHKQHATTSAPTDEDTVVDNGDVPLAAVAFAVMAELLYSAIHNRTNAAPESVNVAVTVFLPAEALRLEAA